MAYDDLYIYDTVLSVEITDGLPEAKTALKQVAFELASTRARGGHLIKVIHDERLGTSRDRLRAEIRRMLRAMKKEGKIILLVCGEKFSATDSTTCYLIDKCPQIEKDGDMGKQNENMTIVYF